MDIEWKIRSGQIPAFGDWDHANELPITQYFECARQAGLIRFSNSSGECDQFMRGAAAADLYSVDSKKPPHHNFSAPRKAKMMREKQRGAQVKEPRKQSKVCDVTDPPRKHHLRQHKNPHYPTSIYDVSYNSNKIDDDVIASAVPPRPRLPVRNPKPVDEDLYKIPPELLRSSKRKKMPGFLACLVPACAS